MSTSISVRPDGVGMITMSNAPVNSLSTAMVTSFKENFPKLVNDPKVKAILVTGEGNMFCGGAEITEFALLTMMGAEHFKDKSATADLCEMMDMIDASPKTTVAALNGQALGGGLEVALACHYRVAGDKVSVGFPEVKLGILPGAQGTQRLPRVAPLPKVIEMIMMGNPVKAAAAQKIGLIDAIAGKDLITDAASFALAKKPNPISKRPVPASNRAMAISGGLMQATNMADTAAAGMVAPHAIIECLRAACDDISFQEGVKVESQEFTKLVFGLQSAALRHLFFAERASLKVPGVDAKPLKLSKIGIVGAGLMGGGIAMCFALKGVPVVLKDAKQEWLDAGVKKIASLWGGQLKKGKMTQEKYDGLMGLIKPTIDYNDFADVDMIIEAVPEIMDLKKEVFLELDKACKPECVICTNTSGLNIDEIAAVLKDPSRVMGCHFFSPANVMQLLENIRITASSAQTLSTGMAMGKLINKKTVMVGNCDGFVGNRMIAPYGAEAKMLFEEGATIPQLEKACTDFGMAMGPISLVDLVGGELFWKQRKAAGDMNKQCKTYYGPYELGDWLCEQGRYGLKTPDPKIKANGRGFFIHRGRNKEVDPEVVAKQEEIRKMKGVTARSVSDVEIIERMFYSLINEGMKILEEGIAIRGSDIDIVYIYGYGFPPAKGGPMFYAEKYVGFKEILERLKVYDAQAKERYTKNKHYLPVDYFEPSKLLIECARVQSETQVPPGQMLVDLVLKQMKKGDKSKL